MNFIDIHCHILPGLDDGPREKSESERMLEIARKDGISDIVATPHLLNGSFDESRDKMELALSELREGAYGIALYTGAEVRLGADLIRRAEMGEVPLINNRRFLLLELPPFLIPPVEVLEFIIRGLRGAGIYPIITHPERNLPISKDLSIMRRLLDCGALFQVTAMSILHPSQIRKCVMNMIKKHYVHAIASDAHDSRFRPPLLSEAFTMIAGEFGENVAERLFVDNPSKIIRGEPL